MTGKDGNTHHLTTSATSLFDAADKAIKAWCKLWWFSPDTALIVRWNEETWTVQQNMVRAWRKRAKEKFQGGVGSSY